jgi:hypothetical protein
LRKASRIVEPIERRSHEAVRQSVGPQVLLSGEQVPREEGLRAFIPS